MKKIGITLLLTLNISAITFAQNRGDVEFGFNLGYNTSTITTSGFSSDTRSGFNIGTSADYYFSDRWSLKGKLIYDQKGWDNGFFEDQSGSYQADYELDYLTIPVMANWHFGKKRNWYLNFGPYAGFLIKAEETAFNSDVKEFFNSTDFGLAFGIGVKIPVSNKLKINLEYDAQSGFSDIFNGSLNEDVLGTRSAFNVGINFMMK